ncbi:type III secretion system needle length determinant, SpaN/EivJ family [Candidatus Fukatsuia endosymbiont of Tuberolachnus salignus]|uniref:SpaN/EivJ family type III secretion system needle length determinant n=1 Tax=Candidatus Fukatsuia endosymbiont of Tuberolachnus salignus TaxID=3077957 RepID=UPI00313F208B
MRQINTTKPGIDPVLSKSILGNKGKVIEPLLDKLHQSGKNIDRKWLTEFIAKELSLSADPNQKKRPTMDKLDEPRLPVVSHDKAPLPFSEATIADNTKSNLMHQKRDLAELPSTKSQVLTEEFAAGGPLQAEDIDIDESLPPAVGHNKTPLPFSEATVVVNKQFNLIDAIRQEMEPAERLSTENQVLTEEFAAGGPLQAEDIDIDGSLPPAVGHNKTPLPFSEATVVVNKQFNLIDAIRQEMEPAERLSTENQVLTEEFAAGGPLQAEDIDIDGSLPPAVGHNKTPLPFSEATVVVNKQFNLIDAIRQEMEPAELPSTQNQVLNELASDYPRQAEHIDIASLLSPTLLTRQRQPVVKVVKRDKHQATSLNSLSRQEGLRSNTRQLQPEKPRADQFDRQHRRPAADMFPTASRRDLASSTAALLNHTAAKNNVSDRISSEGATSDPILSEEESALSVNQTAPLLTQGAPLTYSQITNPIQSALNNDKSQITPHRARPFGSFTLQQQMTLQNNRHHQPENYATLQPKKQQPLQFDRQRGSASTQSLQPVDRLAAKKDASDLASWDNSSSAHPLSKKETASAVNRSMQPLIQSDPLATSPSGDKRQSEEVTHALPLAHGQKMELPQQTLYQDPQQSTPLKQFVQQHNKPADVMDPEQDDQRSEGKQTASSGSVYRFQSWGKEHNVRIMPQENTSQLVLQASNATVEQGLRDQWQHANDERWSLLSDDHQQQKNKHEQPHQEQDDEETR